LEPDYQAGQHLLSAKPCKVKRKRPLDFFNSNIGKMATATDNAKATRIDSSVK
jgi:hypothetical protein